MHRDDHHEPAEYLVTRLKEALAADERVNQLDIEVRITQDDVALVGQVQTDERRQAAEMVARSVLPHHHIVNELQVIELSGAVQSPKTRAIRVAAVGDVHIGVDSAGQLRSCLDELPDVADVLLIAGDLTRHGQQREAEVLAADLEDCGVPVVAVLGNHDYHSDEQEQIMKVMAEGGVTVLEGETAVLEIDGITLGIAGTKGFGGGFAGACASDFGEPIQKQIVAYTRSMADKLNAGLRALDTDLRVALTHFSPIEDTLRGERLEIYPWLGSYLLAEAIDHAGCDWVFHGHAHAGSESGITPGGVQVRNVAQPVIGQAYKVYCLEPSGVMADVTALGVG